MAGQGAPKTGGRQKGTRNRATAAREAAIAGSGITPLEFLVAQMRDETLDLAMRIDAAKSAAPYVHPRLSSVGVGGAADSQPVRVSIIKFADLPTEDLPPER